jgi:integrase
MLTASNGTRVTELATGRISKRSVDALKCALEQDRTFLWDGALEGFGAVAFPSGKKVFVAQFRQNGRSRRISIGKYGTLTPDEARDKAKKVLGAAVDGLDPIQARRDTRAVRTFRELSEEFLRVHVSAKRKPATHEQYKRLLTKYVYPAIGCRRLSDIKPVDISRLHADLADRPTTANRCLAVISAIWNWAARRHEVRRENNPAVGIERNPEKGKERFLSSQELARLGDALRCAETEGLSWITDESKPTSKHIPKGPRLRRLDPHAIAAIRLLVLTGARLREILHAKWAYVDWEQGVINLPDSKTGKKPIYLSNAALTVLETIPRLVDNPYIIPGWKRQKSGDQTKPQPCPRADLKRPWGAVARAAGFIEQVSASDANGETLRRGDGKLVERPTVRIHDLRHSYASIGVRSSFGLPIIGKLLGHSQPTTTARYSHLDADPLRRVANAIGDQIAASLGGKTAKVIPLHPSRDTSEQLERDHIRTSSG